MKKWIEEHAAEQLELLKTISVIPAPSHHEELRAAFLKDWLEKQGAEGVYIDEALNVIYPVAIEGRDDITVYMAHTDVVFPDTTPLPLSEDEENLYCPGVGDDTANLVGLLMAIKYVLSQGMKPRDPLLLVCNSCEEGLGNLKGSRQIVKDFGPRIKEFISFDGGYKGGMVTRAVGSERWKITAKTIGGHSYGAFGNPNAIAYLAKMIGKFYEQKMPDWDDQKTTYNVGLISGGTSVNTIAQNAEMLYEYRSNDKDALTYMHQQLFRIMEESKCDEAQFEIELLGSRPCNGEIDEEAREKLLSRCEKAIMKATAQESVKRRSGSTDANIPLATGIPATTFGLYIGGKAHTREEWVNKASLPIGLGISLDLISSHFDK